MAESPAANPATTSNEAVGHNKRFMPVNVEVSGLRGILRSSARLKSYASLREIGFEIVDERRTRKKEIFRVTLIDVWFIKHCVSDSVVVIRVSV